MCRWNHEVDLGEDDQLCVSQSVSHGSQPGILLEANGGGYDMMVDIRGSLLDFQSGNSHP